MKNMATELGIILIGYFTLVPAIQVLVQARNFAPPPPCSPSIAEPFFLDMPWLEAFRVSVASPPTCTIYILKILSRSLSLLEKAKRIFIPLPL